MHGARGARLGASLILLGLIAGCASLPQQVGPTLNGRLSIAIAAHGTTPARGLQAGFEMRGTGQAGSLQLMNPLGLQVAQASWRPGSVVLRSSQGDHQFADLEALARAALGEPVPLQALPDWLLGRPWPQAHSKTSESGFEQLGWQIDTRQQPDGLVTVTRYAPPVVTMRIRLDSSP